MKTERVNGYKLLATAIIRQGYKDYDQVFINSEWIQCLFELSGHNENDFKYLIGYGKLTEKINSLNSKIRYKKKIGVDYTDLNNEKQKLLKLRKDFRKK